MIKSAAEQGEIAAQKNLAMLYTFGIGTKKNDKAAFKWTKAAAEQGEPESQYNNLGSLYEEGSGVRRNYAAAAKWYRKAAEQGHARAQRQLAWICENGLAVRRDTVEAIKWYQLAAEQGDETSIEALKQLNVSD